MQQLPDLNVNWNEIKTKLKIKFGLLSETDLLFPEGKQDEMLSRLQTKLGRTKEEVHKLIQEL